MQIGKNGLTHKFLEQLKNIFKREKSVRISVLKSATRDRNEIEKIKNKILDELGKNYTCRKIGFTLVLKKWRRAMR